MSLTKVSYAMIQGDPINVLDYGADPTGSADSTTAIQTAIAVVSAAGGVLVIPVGTYLVSGDCGLSDANLTKVKISGYGATLQRAVTTTAYTMFSFRANMTIEGLKLSGYISSGTGYADVIPANSFGFRSASSSAYNVLFIDCEATGLPYDGWYINNVNAQVTLVNCVGKESYRNDFTAVAGDAVVIQGGKFGFITGAITKLGAIDIEPNGSNVVNYVSVTGAYIYHLLAYYAGNGFINHGIADGLTLDGATALFSSLRVQQMDIGQIKFLNGATYKNVGTAETITSNLTLRSTGAFKRLGYLKASSNNLILNPYNSVAGYTLAFSDVAFLKTPNNIVGAKRGIRVTNNGGYNLVYQTVTVTPGEWYSFGGDMVVNAVPTGTVGFYMNFPTLTTVQWLTYTDTTANYVVGEAHFTCCAIKIPAGVTSVDFGFGVSSGAVNDVSFTNVFMCKGIFGEGVIEVPQVTYATAAPTTGTWSVADSVINSVPTVGQPKSWVCTVAGTPGTWVSTGNL